MTKPEEEGVAPAPPSPFVGVAPDLSDPAEGVYSWLIEPAGMLNRYANVFVRLAAATFVTETVDAAMRARFPDTQRFLFIHDFSRCTGYAPEARQLFTDWGMRIRKHVDTAFIVPPPMNAIFNLGVQAATMALRAGGMKVEIVKDLSPVIWRQRVKPAGKPSR